jgi:peptidoglycan/xylan/chitin deacetylase (PgdA/CDA1 family)
MGPSAGYRSVVGLRLLIPALAGALLLAGCAQAGGAPEDPAVAQVAVQAQSLPARPTASGVESRGPAEVVHSIDTTDKVVFITIDDGLYEDPGLVQFLADERIPVTAFLTTGTVMNWPYWKTFESVASIQNHTVTHTSLPTAGDADAEVCGANEAIVQETGQVPWMLRPPYGAYNAGTLAAAGRCGLDWVVHWSVSLPGKKLVYQTKNASLQPGDIILTHFRKGLLPSLRRTVKDIREQGFEVARLEDYLPPRDWQGSDRQQAVEQLPEMTMATQTESRAVLVPGA